jgi:hypothetical protein
MRPLWSSVYRGTFQPAINTNIHRHLPRLTVDATMITTIQFRTFCLPVCYLKVKLRSTIFWDITSYSALKDNRRFEGTYSTACHLLSRWFLARLILRSWRWRRYVPQKRRLTFNGLHGVIAQKTVLFITTAVRTSNPTKIKLSLCFLN